MSGSGRSCRTPLACAGAVLALGDQEQGDHRVTPSVRTVHVSCTVGFLSSAPSRTCQGCSEAALLLCGGVVTGSGRWGGTAARAGALGGSPLGSDAFDLTTVEQPRAGLAG